MLSIIIATYNEKMNVFVVAERIAKINALEPYEIIFIDDSTDDTPEYLEKLSQKDKHVIYEHREGVKGLATAVIRGFGKSHGDIIAVMDADLQHPPELLLMMLKATNDGADIVIPSRFIAGGSDEGLNYIRKTISSTARNMGKVLLHSLRKISDPTSGFFMFRKSVINNVTLNPIGWKILIEILCRGSYQRVVEIPFKFEPRLSGVSKMSIKEQWNYLCHLLRLVKDSPVDRRFYLFCLVGLSGVFINMFIFFLLIKSNTIVVVAGVLAAIGAMIYNFFLNKYVTWKDIENGKAGLEFVKYIVVSTVGIVINGLGLSLFFYYLRVNYLLSNLIGISGGFVWNLMVHQRWTWKNNAETSDITRYLA